MHVTSTKIVKHTYEKREGYCYCYSVSSAQRNLPTRGTASLHVYVTRRTASQGHKRRARDTLLWSQRGEIGEHDTVFLGCRSKQMYHIVAGNITIIDER